MQLIKLTREDGSNICLNPLHVISIEPEGTGSKLKIRDRDSVLAVKEPIDKLFQVFNAAIK